MSDDPTEITPDRGDDPTAARLRAALTAEAAMVHPDDTLSSIRERTQQPPRPWWRQPAVLVTAAAVVLGLAVGGGIALLGGDDDPTVATPGGKGSATTAPTGSPTPSATASTAEGTATPTAAPVEGNVYVYYVMDAGAAVGVAGPRLYREERPNPGASPVSAALGIMFGEPAVDPDYASAWPEGTAFTRVQTHDDVATVDLALPGDTDVDDIAYQQLVYTVTANDDSIRAVRVRLDGGPAGEPVSRAPRLDVQGLIWLLGPAEGATVSSPVEITGYGTAFEGTVNWQVRAQGSDEVVAEGFTDAGANGEFADFSDTVELDPGTYELRVFESSAEDGRPLNTDTKVFTVE